MAPAPKAHALCPLPHLWVDHRIGNEAVVSIYPHNVCSDTVFKKEAGDFPGGTVVKNPPANAGDTGSIPGPGRSHMPRSN